MPFSASRSRVWPAGKYLSYGFWRSWILIVYTAPVWGAFSLDAHAGLPGPSMYVWSTIAFTLVCAVLAAAHMRASALLVRPHLVVLAGTVASLGVLIEYAGLWLQGTPLGALFVLGALLTGAGTAVVAVRAGQIYARPAPATAVVSTALSEVAAGLLFFFVAGTLPVIALLVAAGLPLLAACMAYLDQDMPKEAVVKAASAAAMDTSAVSVAAPVASAAAFTPSADAHDPRSLSIGSFVRFMVMVFVLTFVASMVKGMTDAGQDSEAALESGKVGVTFVILASFFISLAAGMVRSFNFSSIYYPLVLLLAVGVVLVFAWGAIAGAAAVSVFVYSMFSLFMWCLLSFVAHGDYWDPIQVFGWGRAVFGLGSLAGRVVGWVALDVLPSDPVDLLVVGVVLGFVVVASGMFIFRESDVRRIVNAAWLSEESRRSASASEQADDLDAQGSAFVGAQGSAVHVARRAFEPLAQVANGMEPAFRTISADDYADQHNLTAREREVFVQMLEGCDAKAIGAALVISENTAKAHIRNVYAKTGVHTRQEFVEAVRHVER